MKKKVIGVSANILKASCDDNFTGYNKQRLFSGYLDSIIDAGAVPIIIPVSTNKEVLLAQLELVDGVIISGGYDVGPEHYNEEPTRLIQEVHHLRDEFEMMLVSLAIEKDIPLFGICRGHQLINVVLGGSLYQDNSQHEKHFVKHTQQASPEYPSHSVEIEKDSFLYDIFGEKAMINSYHHQSIKDIAKGLKVVAKASDNIVEAVEWENDEKVIMGVQWHPEMMTKNDEKMLDIFKCFINKCK